MERYAQIKTSTCFGHIVAGSYGTNINDNICNLLQVYISDHGQLKRFRELEGVEVHKFSFNEDIEYEMKFNVNTFRDKTGQFDIKFPFKHAREFEGYSCEKIYLSKKEIQ